MGRVSHIIRQRKESGDHMESRTKQAFAAVGSLAGLAGARGRLERSPGLPADCLQVACPGDREVSPWSSQVQAWASLLL